MNHRFLPILAVVCIGCTERTEIQKSPELTESGIVIDTVHTSPSSHTDIEVGWGTDANGNLTTSLTPVTTRIPETWGVVFRCEHGNKFVIEGKDDRYKDLWERLDPGMTVRIHYKEEHRVTTNKQDDGTWRETKRELVDFDFINAFPVEAVAEVTE